MSYLSTLILFIDFPLFSHPQNNGLGGIICKKKSVYEKHAYTKFQGPAH